MLNSLKKQTRYALEVALAFTPWLISMYVLYWLEHGEIWTTDTAHRGKTTIAILAVGMGLSLLVQSRIARREQK
jgi:hypothetical protein